MFAYNKIMMILFCFLLSFTSWAEITYDLTILVDGKKVKTLTPSDLKKIKLVKLDFYNSVSKRSEDYRGWIFSDLMQVAGVDKGKSIVEVEFSAVNGFKSYFSYDMFVKAPAILSYERVDGEKFVRYSQKEKMLVDLGPYYLIWDQKKMSASEQQPYNSVYQINQINFLTNQIDFGLVADKVDSNLYLGLRSYKKYCLSCHALGKLGGNLAMDLLQKNILEAKGDDYFIKYTLAPASVFAQTKMLPLPKFKNSQAMAQGIVEFLKFAKNPEKVLKTIKAKSGQSVLYNELSQLVDEMKP